ncbi:MAG TPA: FAD-binding oxidoreductase [Candidatus Hydrogenedentes bacterium]|jgi:FAD/FMN-containing dehydrogenase|nr:FAD-binding oxidoreductase [Candidatus Hydrogenedentota bacterium]HPX86719.1 FAD-binding oxidoreductase [Candidatus Hydrogenedentota bacterium]HQB02438.1 FAD-binding oxidoreductase [Candidatus Hydrogenedentota bacterium]
MEGRSVLLNTASINLAGWGRYHPKKCSVFRPERTSELKNFLEESGDMSFIARGLGRSYGDTAVNSAGLALDMSRMNRMLYFDEEHGILECEGGVTLAEILDAFVSRGWFLPVTPGTKFVTVGGAIANDVHGKNHHVDGTFCQFVDSFDLWVPSKGVLTCSASENSDLFWATAGGVGLTGVILKVRLQLRAVETAYVKVDYRRCAHLDDVLEKMAATDQDYLYSVAWIDCLARRQQLGRSVLMQGAHARLRDLPVRLERNPFRLPKKAPLAVPVDFPGFVLNNWSIKAFNTLFYLLNRDKEQAIINYDKYFYPLDGIHDWNRMYGRRGFIQYQAAFPYEGRTGLVKMLELLSEKKRASFLAVLKCFGASNPGLLSYPMPGYTLALDIPCKKGIEDFTKELDRILLDHGGRLYLAKDAVTDAATFASMYPALERFRSLRRELDPQQLLSSDQAKRLHLV